MAPILRRFVFSVQMLDNKNRWIPLGSGFFFQGPDSVARGLTCSHVIRPAIKKKVPIFIGMNTPVTGYDRFICEIEFDDSVSDFAVLIPHRKSDRQNKYADNTCLTENQLGIDSLIVEGKGVAIPGYPLGIGVDVNAPVLRTGIIAQFTGGESFLIDGIASHGNSGSPVVVSILK